MTHSDYDRANQLNEKGIQLLGKGFINDALACFENATQLDNQHAHAFCNIGRIYYEKRQWHTAVDYFKHAITCQPLPEAYSNMGLTLHQLNAMNKALGCYQKALTLKPNYPIACHNMGFTLEKLGRLDESIQWYERAIALDPNYIDAHTNMGITLLLAGNFRRGFAEYEWRLKTPEFQERSFQSTQWDGRSFVNKRLLIYPEQGYGDCIQFIRYLPEVKKRGGTVILEMHEFLVRLFDDSVPFFDKMIIHSETIPPKADYHVAIASLPHILKTDIDSIPCDMPYLFPPEQEKSLLSQTIQMIDAFRVGISWAGSPIHKNDKNRSCNLELFYPLTQIPGVVLFSIQKGPAADDLKQKKLPIVDLSDLIHDFADTATAVHHMDLIISVDTATAHLAGAMGKPTWVLIPHAPDWRWLRDRTDSLWYPAMKLFRQPSFGDFASVIESIRQALMAIQKDISAFHFLKTVNKTAIALHKKNRLNIAIHIYKRLIQLNPRIHFFYINLGLIYLQTKQLDLAIQYFENALKYNPESSQAYRYIGIVYRQQGNFAASGKYYQKALKINPDDAYVYDEMGVLFEKMGQPEKSIQCYQRSISLNPNRAETYRNLSHAQMMHGHLREGFKNYEWRLKCADYNSRIFNEIPKWTGERFDNQTLFLCTEQGFGDIIQFIRYAPMVKSLGGTVTFGTFPNMVRLISQVKGIDRVFSNEPMRNFNWQIQLMSLPAIFETDIDTIPINIPYIYPPEKPGKWVSIIRDHPAKLKIGLAWAGSPKHSEDQFRSMSLETLQPLLNLSHTQEIAFFSLQIGERGLTESDKDLPIIDLNPHIDDFSDSAAAIDALDLVISVDTSTVHLAGAMGKPVWLMIPVSPDWRWMLDRTDSPWYPTLRIYRQKELANWETVINQIVTDLCIECGKNGDIFYHKNQLKQAESWYQLAIKIDPDYLPAITNMGVICEKHNQIDAAINWYRKALSIDPESAPTHKNLGHALLLKGHFTEGFKAYQWRLKCDKFINDPKHDIPFWKGEPLENKTILLYSEQGFGDIIQFIRYAPLLKKRGATTVAITFPNLTRLLNTADGVDRAVSNASEDEFDFQVHMLTLPHLLGTNEKTIPSEIPYFQVAQKDMDRFEAIIQSSGDKLCVGLIWAGDPKHPNDSNRSISLDLLSPVLDMQNMQCYSFQKEFKSDIDKRNIIDLSDHIQDFYDTAAAMTHMDAIISVDTAPAHLAGALGKKVYLLLPCSPDWRWMLNRTDSPWYPDMKLLRQPKPGQWQPVIDQLITELADIFCEKGDHLLKSNQHKEATQMYEHALACNPEHSKTCNNMGVASDLEQIKKPCLVHGIGYFQGHTGYNIHTKNFFSQLKPLVPFVQTDLQALHLTRETTDAALNQSKDPIINIAITYGNKMNILSACPGFRIGYTVWESTRLPDDWLEPMKIPHQLWTPTTFCKNVMIDHGFDANKIKVIPEGIDPEMFHPQVKPLPGSEKIPGFKFLNVGKYEERKCTADMIKAFDEEFINTKDVVLILACHNFFEKGFDIRKKLKDLHLKCPEKILLIDPVAEHHAVAQLYAAADAFIFPTRAEGWGLPIIEAIATGLPTIVTHYSGQTEFLTPEMAYLLDYTLTDIPIPFFLSKDNDYGQWAQPDMQQFRYYMRYIYENQDEAKQKGLNAARIVHEKWTWKHAAKKAVLEIEEFLKTH